MIFHPELSFPLPARRPLVKIHACVPILDLDPRQISALVDSGGLAWAFDLAVPGAHRREIRIWRQSLATFNKSTGRDSTADLPEPEVLADILPSWHPHSSDLARRLQISRDLLADLIRARLLAVQAAPLMHQGPNAACRLDRPSVLAFLRSRRCH